MPNVFKSVVVLNTTLHKHITGSPNNTNISSLPISRSYFALANRICGSTYDVTRSFDYGHPATKPQEGETLEYGARFRECLNYLDRASQWSTAVANAADEPASDGDGLVGTTPRSKRSGDMLNYSPGILAIQLPPPETNPS
ncbi:uncharacterized protein EI90DRAFT_3020275 [Cantharellus anzutake]|uniref:uncharacterized protein n=1 Tax=Cantharellus anzutake TaxID=1750568 RepID=UPI0019052064|nr:uncharacterized protein EI90DRAFT_3020275 [Cantharellus anzutake]KAF8321378.1 hypothetical protein EI90DRAFT_3020275 [Cantharellus anzutake]